MQGCIQYLADSRQINLLNTGGLTLQFWNANGEASSGQLGGGNGTWSLTAPNWTDAQGATNAPMQPVPGFAIFGGMAGTVTVAPCRQRACSSPTTAMRWMAMH